MRTAIARRAFALQRLLSVIAVVVVLAFTAAAPAYAIDVKRVVSPGGIEAWFVEDATVPLVSLEFTFRGGAALDPKGKAGLANLVAGLLDQGAGDLDSQAVQRQLRDQSIRLSFSTSYEGFGGSLKTLNRYRDNAFDLLRLALTEPRFDTAAVERIRGETLADIRRQAMRPGNIARRIWARAAFPDHPYGWPTTGTSSTVEAIAVDDLREFVRTRLTQDQLLIGVVGDIGEEELGRLLDKTFGKLPVEPVPDTVPETAPHALGATIVVQRPLPQSVALFSLPGVARDDPDYYAAYVMNHILGGGSFRSRFFHEVRDRHGLAYSVHSYLSPWQASPLWIGSVATANAGMAKSLELIRQEMKRMREEPVSEQELSDAKGFINGSFPLRFTSTDRLASILVAMQYHDLGIDYLDRRPSFIDSVTSEDVLRAAQRLLDVDKLTVTVVGQPVGVEATLEAPDIDS